MGNDLPSGTTLKLVTNDAYNSSTFTTWINPNYRDPKTIEHSNPIPDLQILSGVYLQDHKQVGTANLTPLECYFACERDQECVGVDISTNSGFDWKDNNKYWCGMIKKADLKQTDEYRFDHATHIDKTIDGQAQNFSSYIKKGFKFLRKKVPVRIDSPLDDGYVFTQGANAGGTDLQKLGILPIHKNSKWNQHSACYNACSNDNNCKGYTWYPPKQVTLALEVPKGICKLVSNTDLRVHCPGANKQSPVCGYYSDDWVLDNKMWKSRILRQ